jgi:hypothetical protein
VVSQSNEHKHNVAKHLVLDVFRGVDLDRGNVLRGGDLASGQRSEGTGPGLSEGSHVNEHAEKPVGL